MYIEEEGFFKRNRETLLLLALGLAASTYVALCVVKVLLAFMFLFGCICLYAFYKNHNIAFMLYIILLPFSCIPYFNGLPLNINGIKLLLLLLMANLGLFILYKRPFKVNIIFNIFFIALIMLYVTAWIRSADYALSTFAPGHVGELSIMRYIIDYASWTFIVFIPLVAIAYFYRSEKEIENIIKTIAVSASLLVGYLLFVFVFKIGNRGDFEAIRVEFGKFTGLHGNDIANYFTISFPVILAWAFYKRSYIAFFSLGAIAVGTAISFSRTAYFVVAFSVFLFLFLSGKLKWIPVLAMVGVLAVKFLLPDMVVERAETGIGTGNYDELSAGRINYIWEPLLNELKTDPEMLLFGSGRYGIMNTDAWMQARISMVTHAHNMYLDCILDMGIIGLAVFLAFFAVVLVYFYKASRRYKKDFPYHSGLLIGCTVSVICYLVSGLTGRSFFPTLSNVYLWIVIGLGIAICGYLRRNVL